MSVETSRLPPDTDRLAVQEAIEANMHAYWLSLAQRPLGTRSDGHDLKWAYTGSPVLNRVAGARLDDRDVDARIAEVVERFQTWKAGVTWLTGPLTRPADLGRRLEGHGFSYQEAWTGMALDLTTGAVGSDSGPPGLTVGEADAGAARAAWLDVVGTAFRLPPEARGVFGRLPGPGDAKRDSGAVWHRYIGFLHGTPVSAAALVGAGGAAGVYLVGTLPGARHRGFATALTRHVLAEARRRGYGLAVLQSTDAGRGLYRRLGFLEYGAVGVYRWPPPPRWGLRRLILRTRLGPLWRRPG